MSLVQVVMYPKQVETNQLTRKVPQFLKAVSLRNGDISPIFINFPKLIWSSQWSVPEAKVVEGRGAGKPWVQVWRHPVA